jgi:hypothetical protein
MLCLPLFFLFFQRGVTEEGNAAMTKKMKSSSAGISKIECTLDDDSRFQLAGRSLYRNATHIVFSFLELVDYGALGMTSKQTSMTVSNYFQTGLRSIRFPKRRRTSRDRHRCACRLLVQSARQLRTIEVDVYVRRFQRSMLTNLVRHNAPTLEVLVCPAVWTVLSTFLLSHCPKIKHVYMQFENETTYRGTDSDEDGSVAEMSMEQALSIMDSHLHPPGLVSLDIDSADVDGNTAFEKTTLFGLLLDRLDKHPSHRIERFRWKGTVPIHLMIRFLTMGEVEMKEAETATAMFVRKTFLSIREIVLLDRMFETGLKEIFLHLWIRALTFHASSLQSLTYDMVLGDRVIAPEDMPLQGVEFKSLHFLHLHTLNLMDACYASGACKYIRYWSAPNLKKCTLGMNLLSAATFLDKSGPLVYLEELHVKIGGRDPGLTSAYKEQTTTTMLRFLTGHRRPGLRVMDIDECTQQLLDALFTSRHLWATRLATLNLRLLGACSPFCLRQALLLSAPTLVQLHLRVDSRQSDKECKFDTPDTTGIVVLERLRTIRLHYVLAYMTLETFANLQAPRLRSFISHGSYGGRGIVSSKPSSSSTALWQLLSTPTHPLRKLHLSVSDRMDVEWFATPNQTDIPRIGVHSFEIILSIAGIDSPGIHEVLATLIHSRLQTEPLQSLRIVSGRYNNIFDINSRGSAVASRILLADVVFPNLVYVDIDPADASPKDMALYFAHQPALRRLNVKDNEDQENVERLVSQMFHDNKVPETKDGQHHHLAGSKKNLATIHQFKIVYPDGDDGLDTLDGIELVCNPRRPPTGSRLDWRFPVTRADVIIDRS